MKLSTIVRATVMGTSASLALGACTVGPGATQSGASSQDASAVTIGLTYIPNVQFAPVYVADSQGLYNDAGITPTVRHHGSDEGLFTALLAGQEDVVIYATLAAIKAGGLQTSDVTISSIGYTQQAALAAGQVDAVVGFTNNDAVQMRLAGTDIREIPLDGASTPLVAASIITTREWAQSHPDAARAVVSATTEAMNMIAADPQVAIDATAKWDTTLSDETSLAAATAVLAATVPLWLGDDAHAVGVQDLATWSSMVSFLNSIGVLEGEVDPNVIVTNEYANTADTATPQS